MVDFKITLNSNTRVQIEGNVEIEEINDDECVWWYDGQNNLYNTALPINPISTGSHEMGFNKIWEDYETLINTYANDELFLDCIFDLQEGGECNRGNYTIKVY